MGGYIAFEMVRQAPDRIERLALLDTSALSDTLEQTERRLKLIAMAQTGEFKSVRDTLWPLFVHPARHDNVALKRAVFKMMDDTVQLMLGHCLYIGRRFMREHAFKIIHRYPSLRTGTQYQNLAVVSRYEGSISNFGGKPHDQHTAKNLSSKIIENGVLAATHSRACIFHVITA